jgi:hypothetical protein
MLIQHSTAKRWLLSCFLPKVTQQFDPARTISRSVAVGFSGSANVTQQFDRDARSWSSAAEPRSSFSS